MRFVRGVINELYEAPYEQPQSEHLRQQVRAALSADACLDAAAIRVTVVGFTVYLQGYVRSVQEERRAPRLARAVPGLLGTFDELHVLDSTSGCNPDERPLRAGRVSHFRNVVRRLDRLRACRDEAASGRADVSHAASARPPRLLGLEFRLARTALNGRDQAMSETVARRRRARRAVRTTRRTDAARGSARLTVTCRASEPLAVGRGSAAARRGTRTMPLYVAPTGHRRVGTARIFGRAEAARAPTSEAKATRFTLRRSLWCLHFAVAARASARSVCSEEQKRRCYRPVTHPHASGSSNSRSLGRF